MKGRRHDSRTNQSQVPRQGETITAWAKKHGYSPHYVYFVLNGQSKARWGKGHEIAVKLGLKTEA